MAREMALAGVDRSELTPPPPPQAPKGLSAKIANLWYHHKPIILIVGFLLVVVLWMVINHVTKNPADYTVAFVTEDPLTTEEIAAVESYLEACGQDVDGDGRVEVELENLTPYYQDEMAPTIARTDNDRLQAHLATGEVMIFAFEKSAYDRFNQTISEVTSDEFVFFAPLNTTCESYDDSIDAWSWQGDNRLLEHGLAGLPEDIVFGVRSVDGTAYGKDAVALHENGKQLIETLIQSAIY